MNKKLFASALFAAGAFVSTSALAALGYETSVGNTADGYLQTGNAKVAAGGSSVRANDILINVGAATDIPAKSEIVIRLPVGLNFSEVPGFKVTQGTPGVGLTLKDGSEFGDPTLDNPGVTWSDANGDGGYDRAVVTVAAAGAAGDSLTISVNLTADSTAKAEVKKVSVVVNSGLAVPQDVVEVVSGFTEPVFSASGTKLKTLSQSAQTATVSTAKFTVTVPKGTAGASKVTMTPESKLTFSSSGSTITYAINTPVKMFPFTVATSTGTFALDTKTPSLTFTVTGSATATLSDDIQVEFTVNEIAIETGVSVGPLGLKISGAAEGTAALVDVKKSASSAALTKATIAAPNKVAEIVSGSLVEQALPTIDITENFDGDAITAGSTGTITLTPSAGLKFGATSSITVAGTGWTLEAPSATISSTGKLTLTLGNASSGSKTVTISGLKATATKTATGDLSVTVGSPGSPDKSTAPKDTLVVAKAVAVGTVTVAGPKTLNNTAPGGVSQTATITLKESTYGALSRANATQVQSAYFRLTPSAETTISAIAISYTGYAAGTSPTISSNTPCAKETGATTGAWICIVEAESSAVTPTTSTISLAVDYQVGAKAASGSKVTLTIDGNSNVSGSADIANVGIATTATKGAVPNVTPGGTEVVNFATLTIKEKFAGAVTNGKIFRLIAPQGAVFQNAAAIVAQSAGISAATITSTFNPNDTLVMTNATTATIVVTTKGLLSSSASGFQSFSLVDGDLEGKNKAGVTAESVMLAYGGTLEALDAGDNADVNVGYTVQNTVEGGLNTTDYPYTVASSDASVASPTITASVVTVTGKAVGNAIITVTDGLGAAATYTVTVSAGAAEPAAVKAAKASDGSATSASFTGGATSDGGTSFATEFTTSDTVTLVGTVSIDVADQGEAGAIYVALSKKTSSGTENFYMDESGTAQPWDLTVANLGEHIVAESLAASYDVQVYNGTLDAGEYRVALAYSVGGKLIYTAKAMVITVTE